MEGPDLYIASIAACRKVPAPYKAHVEHELITAVESDEWLAETASLNQALDKWPIVMNWTSHTAVVRRVGCKAISEICEGPIFCVSIHAYTWVEKEGERCLLHENTPIDPVLSKETAMSVGYACAHRMWPKTKGWKGHNVRPRQITWDDLLKAGLIQID